jgi:serine/threonine protein phosphatase PrpC
MGADGTARIELRAAVLTDVGVVRDHNEDSAHVDPRNRYFIVADGMGGHAAGEVASAMAVETVRGALERAGKDLDEFARRPSEEGRKGAVATLEAAVRSAHKAVFERGAKESDKQGMGTTLDVVLIAGPEAFVAHVGDSRTYLIREGKAAQITTDHTVAEVLVIEGKLSLEEAQISPLRTILVNAIGVAPDVGVEMAHIQLRKGDMLLLCSDGLHDYFPVEQELADRVAARQPAESLAELIELAKDRGGHDNITGVLVEVMECEGVQVPLEPGQIQAALNNGSAEAAAPDKPIERDDTMPVDVDGKKQPSPQRTTDPDIAAVRPDDDTMEIAIPTEAIAKIEAERERERAEREKSAAPDKEVEGGDSGPTSKSGRG